MVWRRSRAGINRTHLRSASVRGRDADGEPCGGRVAPERHRDLVRPQARDPGDRIARLEAALGALRAAHPDGGLVSARQIINPLLDLWAIAAAIDWAVARPIEQLLAGLARRSAVTAAEVSESLDDVGAALARFAAATTQPAGNGWLADAGAPRRPDPSPPLSARLLCFEVGPDSITLDGIVVGDRTAALGGTPLEPGEPFSLSVDLPSPGWRDAALKTLARWTDGDRVVEIALTRAASGAKVNLSDDTTTTRFDLARASWSP